MTDRTRAEALSWDASSFEGRHYGFPNATHTRRVELGKHVLRIRDTVTSSDSQELEWTFPWPRVPRTGRDLRGAPGVPP